MCWPPTLMQGNSGSLTQVRGRGDYYRLVTILQCSASFQLPCRDPPLLKPPVVTACRTGTSLSSLIVCKGPKALFSPSSHSHDKDDCGKVISEHRQERQESFMDYLAAAVKNGCVHFALTHFVQRLESYSHVRLKSLVDA